MIMGPRGSYQPHNAAVTEQEEMVDFEGALKKAGSMS